MNTPLSTDIALEAKQLMVVRSGQVVLQQLSFVVEKGQIFALLGGNGAGKSTTLLTFLGFLPPTAGAAYVQGLNVEQHTREVRQAIAYLPEATTLYTHLSAQENLSYLLTLAGRQIDRAAIDKALDTVGLPTRAHAQRLDAYSKGMRQKVAIALALLRETPILLLDEPTSGLDPVAIDELNTLVQNLAAEGRTVLMVTHDVYGACQVADRIALLHNGSLVGTFSASKGAPIDTNTVHTAFKEQTVR
ncbi:MAG: ABC transporter ATP-binding protein [Myxococcales bacterium]|nr:ABC transporter ATP-binding protein [Myxococcales bacterium]